MIDHRRVDGTMRGQVLIVEDDADIRDEVRDALIDAGYLVRTASNGHEALECLDGGVTPRLILLDLMMPAMDGRELLRRLRADGRWSNIPVVVMSAQSLFAVDGANGYLAKPFDLADLLAMTARYLPD